jgi:hypothetical protein
LQTTISPFAFERSDHNAAPLAPASSAVPFRGVEPLSTLSPQWAPVALPCARTPSSSAGGPPTASAFRLPTYPQAGWAGGKALTTTNPKETK